MGGDHCQVCHLHVDDDDGDYDDYHDDVVDVDDDDDDVEGAHVGSDNFQICDRYLLYQLICSNT